MTVTEKLKQIGAYEKYLPVNCYSSERHLFKPKRLERVKFLVIHGFSVINLFPDDPYNPEYCWYLFRDQNYPKAERLYVMKRPGDPVDRVYGSAHIIIQRNGDIELWVPLEFQAYHAGASFWKGEKNLNDCSIGVEAVTADGDDLTEEQYDSLAQVSKIVMEHHHLDLSDVPGHYQISPGRKTDPWPAAPGKLGFRWSYYYNKLKEA